MPGYKSKQFPPIKYEVFIDRNGEIMRSKASHQTQRFIFASLIILCVQLISLITHTTQAAAVSYDVTTRDNEFVLINDEIVCNVTPIEEEDSSSGHNPGLAFSVIGDAGDINGDVTASEESSSMNLILT